MKIKIILIALTLTSCNWLLGTGTPECTTPGAKRCRANKVEVCAGDKHWEKIIDCNKYPGMVCCDVKLTCTKEAK